MLRDPSSSANTTRVGFVRNGDAGRIGHREIALDGERPGHVDLRPAGLPGGVKFQGFAAGDPLVAALCRSVFTLFSDEIGAGSRATHILPKVECSV